MAAVSRVPTEIDMESSNSSKTPDIMDVCPQLINTIARRLSKRISSLQSMSSAIEEVASLSRKSSTGSKHVQFGDHLSQDIDELFSGRPIELTKKVSIDVMVRDVLHDLKDICNSTLSDGEATAGITPEADDVISSTRDAEAEPLMVNDDFVATLVDPLALPASEEDFSEDAPAVDVIDEEATLIASPDEADVIDDEDIPRVEMEMDIDVIKNIPDEPKEKDCVEGCVGESPMEDYVPEGNDVVEPDSEDIADQAVPEEPLVEETVKEAERREAEADIADDAAPEDDDAEAADCPPGPSAVYVPMGPPPIQVAFSFDTTGSMSQCIDEVKGQLRVMIERLFSDIPNLEISIIAHGDYCDEEHFYVTKSIDFTNNIAALCEFVNSVEGTGGGDFEECYEHVLHLIRTKLPWSPNARRSVVMIGDAIPHEPDNECNKEHLDWKEEADKMKEDLVSDNYYINNITFFSQ